MRLVRRFTAVSILITLVAGFGLTGCGTKGALYIPEQRYPQDSK